MNHSKIEKNVGLMAILVVVAISFGGLVEIVPLFALEETTKPVEGLRPYTALQLEGRDIYIREGCHVCHTQMVRPLRAEVERFGAPSEAGEYIYDHPFLWGSKRTGPDLHRVGTRDYSDEWHRQHLVNPRSVVAESNMPAFAFLQHRILDGKITAKKMKALSRVGVPYTQEDMDGAKDAVKGKSEMTALIAYLQNLGQAYRRTQIIRTRLADEANK
ncbi:MAG: cytochrome-c oxidase, cbb3-type subunit II [Saccharospirillaceae bacterium]|nr:cytochrome-c oxidase, cbb3-type subunit II [Pseudomonadales bacterium]NRB78234.1 cytochrome-c oxidase, cbb3-type subunit II [Saccharospirillaceae bacterium]